MPQKNDAVELFFRTTEFHFIFLMSNQNSEAILRALRESQRALNQAVVILNSAYARNAAVIRSLEAVPEEDPEEEQHEEEEEQYEEEQQEEEDPKSPFPLPARPAAPHSLPPPRSLSDRASYPFSVLNLKLPGKPAHYDRHGYHSYLSQYKRAMIFLQRLGDKFPELQLDEIQDPLETRAVNLNDLQFQVEKAEEAFSSIYTSNKEFRLNSNARELRSVIFKLKSIVAEAQIKQEQIQNSQAEGADFEI